MSHLQTIPNLVTYMDVRSALASNDTNAVKTTFLKAHLEERRQCATEAIKDFLLQTKDTNLISNEIFDLAAEFIINQKLFTNLYKLRKKMRRVKIDRRFIDFYKFCISEEKQAASQPSIITDDDRNTPISVAMRIKAGFTATKEEITHALSSNCPAFARDWIYRAAAGAHPEYLSTAINHVNTLSDLESLLHELSIYGPLYGGIHSITKELSDKVNEVILKAPLRARKINEGGFGDAFESPRELPKVIVGSKLMRSDLEAFNSRFVMQTTSGYLAYGFLGIGLGQYAVIYDGSCQTLLSLDGVTPSPAHIPSFLKLDSAALDQLLSSDTILLNPNFSRLGDCLDRFSFVSEIVEASKKSTAGLSRVNILESISDNFISPQKHVANSNGVNLYSVADVRSKKFERHYINSCHSRNNIDRRFSLSKKMVKALSSKDPFDSQCMTIENLKSNGYFILHFAIESEKRSFKNQWEVLAQAIVSIRRSGISKIVMLNSGLTSKANASNPKIVEFESDWPERICKLLPPEHQKNAFIPIDLHMMTVDRKARAISMSDFFIGGLVTATLLPTASGVPSLIIGSKTSLSDEYRWPSGEQTFFVPRSSSTEMLSDQAKSVSADLHGQYMSYAIDRETLYSRLAEALSVAIRRWHRRSAR